MRHEEAESYFRYKDWMKIEMELSNARESVRRLSERAAIYSSYFQGAERKLFDVLEREVREHNIVDDFSVQPAKRSE